MGHAALGFATLLVVFLGILPAGNILWYGWEMSDPIMLVGGGIYGALALRILYGMWARFLGRT